MKDYDAVEADKMWEDHVDRVDRYLRRRQDFNEMLFGSFGREQRITPIMPRLRADSGGRAHCVNRVSSMSVPVAHSEWPQEATPAPSVLRPNMSQYSMDSSLRSIQFAEQKALLGSFEDFWRVHCQVYAKVALRMFYLGMVSLLVALAILMYAKLEHTYRNTTAALVFVSFIFLSIVGTVYVLVAINNNVDPAIVLEPGRTSTRHLENLPRESRHYERNSGEVCAENIV